MSETLEINSVFLDDMRVLFDAGLKACEEAGMCPCVDRLFEALVNVDENLFGGTLIDEAWKEEAEPL